MDRAGESNAHFEVKNMNKRKTEPPHKDIDYQQNYAIHGCQWLVRFDIDDFEHRNSIDGNEMMTTKNKMTTEKSTQVKNIARKLFRLVIECDATIH